MSNNKRSMEEDLAANKAAKTDEVDDDFSDDGSEYDDENNKQYSMIKKPLEFNAETIVVPLLYQRSEVKAYMNLIKNSPLSKVIKFEDGYHPRKKLVKAICAHGGFTELELMSGDWEAWISRFPPMFKCLPRLKRVVIAGASQSGCGGYDELILACLDLPELEFLDCSQNWEDMGQGTALAELIRKHPTLKVINMADNDLEEDEERAVVQAISDAAKEKKLVLEDLIGLSLKDEKWMEILELPEDKADMSNKDILAYLKEA